MSLTRKQIVILYSLADACRSISECETFLNPVSVDQIVSGYVFSCCTLGCQDLLDDPLGVPIDLDDLAYEIEEEIPYLVDGGYIEKPIACYSIRKNRETPDRVTDRYNDVGDKWNKLIEEAKRRGL